VCENQLLLLFVHQLMFVWDSCILKCELFCHDHSFRFVMHRITNNGQLYHCYIVHWIQYQGIISRPVRFTANQLLESLAYLYLTSHVLPVGVWSFAFIWRGVRSHFLGWYYNLHSLVEQGGITRFSVLTSTVCQLVISRTCKMDLVCWSWCSGFSCILPSVASQLLAVLCLVLS
jgi:hypothetical protein